MGLFDRFKSKPQKVRRTGGKIDPPAPPIDERPKCAQCSKTLRPKIIKTETGRAWGGEYMSWGHFCSLACGCQWANDEIDKRKAA